MRFVGEATFKIDFRVDVVDELGTCVHVDDVVFLLNAATRLVVQQPVLGRGCAMVPFDAICWHILAY